MVKTFLFMIEMMNYAIFNDLMFYNVLESLTLEFNIGFLLGFSFIIQISSGFFLTCFYIADSDVAYDSIQFFTRNIVSCWIFRFIHVNGATILFLLFYLHIFKGLSNLSFKLSRELVGITGFVIFFLSTLIGFTGYSLVGGQMSYGALTVITNLVTALPFIGLDLLEGVGSNSVIESVTLRRFFCIHFVTPFIALGVLLVHLILIHRNVSKLFFDLNVLSVDKIKFTIFIIKDFTFFLGILTIGWLLSLSIGTKLFMHPDNFIYAMPFVTPTFIEPEWYFLPYYAILRSIPHKLIGTISLVASLLLYLMLLIVHDFHFMYWFLTKINVYGLLFTLCSLGVLAVKPLVYPFGSFNFISSFLFIGTMLLSL